MKRQDLKPGAVENARALRRRATPEERILWQTLRRHMSAAKFRRQVPIGRYFADFASHGAKLVIELDGGQHATQADYDTERTRFLRGEGYRVIRFWNSDVKENIEGVFRAIEEALQPSSSPPVGEGEPGPHMTLNRSPSPLVGEGGPKGRMRGSQPLAKRQNPSPHPSPTRGEGESVNLSVGV